MDTEETSHREKVLNDEVRLEGTPRAATDGMIQSEHKQQERRKKAAMFLSRLKKGSKEEESNAQPVYGNFDLIFVMMYCFSHLFFIACKI